MLDKEFQTKGINTRARSDMYELYGAGVKRSVGHKY